MDIGCDKGISLNTKKKGDSFEGKDSSSVEGKGGTWEGKISYRGGKKKPKFSGKLQKGREAKIF